MTHGVDRRDVAVVVSLPARPLPGFVNVSVAKPGVFLQRILKAAAGGHK